MALNVQCPFCKKVLPFRRDKRGVLPTRGNGTDGAIHRHMFNGDQERTAREMLKPPNSYEAFQRAHGLSVSN